MSDNLTPTAQAILDHLRERPATATDLRNLTGRGRSTIDKTLTDLAKTGLVTKTTPDGADGNDGPALWSLTDPGTATETHDDPADSPADKPTDDGPSSQADTDKPDSPGPPPGEQDDETRDETPATTGTSPAEEVKVCRGCGDQMPRVCPACWSKTTAYCGHCRKTHPTRRRAPGEPQILANGLPKLRPGQLEHLVADVIASHPLPDHLGITGWTPGRVAIFLPGRSTGAIANALDKLAANGRTQLIGEDPKRYQLTPGPQPPSDADPPHTPGDSDHAQ